MVFLCRVWYNCYINKQEAKQLDKVLSRKLAIQRAQVEMLSYGLSYARYKEQLDILHELESGDYDATNKYHRLLDNIVKSPLYEIILEALLEDINESKLANKRQLEYDLNHAIENLRQTAKPITIDDFDNW